MITENSLGQKINNPEKFWQWFGDSITVDEQGRPRVFYHGTRSDFTEFQSSYSDKLIFFSYEKKFADDWGKSKRGYSNELSNEIFDKVRVFQNNLFKEYQAKYGEDFYIENEEMYKKYHKEVDTYEEELEKERNVHSRTLGCYLKVTKLFIPERDSDLVLDEIVKYYHWESKSDLDDKIKKAENAFDKANNEFDEWWKNNKNATEEEKKEQDKKLDIAYHAMFSLKNEKAQFDNDLKRIKQGAWIYFEHGNVIDKIYELGYDAIQLSERDGEQTTIAVRTGRNQIKSIDNKGSYNSSENIYEDLNNNFYRWFRNSKVVDSNNNPLIVYHGSPVKFNEFKPNLMNYGSISKDFCFFTNKKSAYPNCAKDYAGKNGYVYECYLRIEKPYYIRYGNTPEEYYHTPIHYWDTCQSDIRRIYKKGDFDGIIIENKDKNMDDSVIYLVPNANQIKSVDNNGKWSENKNIYERFNKRIREVHK